MQPKDAALRKRTQISKANRTMFIWIAAASALVGFALVVSIFLAQKLFFNEKILAEKQNTVNILAADNKVIPDLESEVQVLDTNQDLASVKAQPTDQAIQVILDALPSDANSSALGASLQQRLLAGINGLTVQSLQVDPVTGVESLGAGGDNTVAAASASGSNPITFRFTVAGDQVAFKQVLTNLEKSIRTIDVTSMHITNAGTSQLMTIEGQAYYEPSKTVDLQDKVVKP